MADGGTMPHLALAGTVLLCTLCVDQATKTLLLRRLVAGDEIRLRGGARLRRVVNVRWALGRRASVYALLLLWTLLCAGGLLLLDLRGSGGTTAAVAVGVALGGATGNLVDWLLQGGIVDFVDLRFWPVFNVADAGITAGIALLVLALVV